jgi:hypothetical protein
MVGQQVNRDGGWTNFETSENRRLGVYNMTTKRLLWIFFLVCSRPSFALSEVRPRISQQGGVAVSSRFQFAEPFVRTLEGAGIVVQSVEGSTSAALFSHVKDAAFIRTNQGVVEIVVFPGSTDAEQLSIIYTKDGPNGHRYRIEGPVLTGPGPTIHAAAPEYFTLYKNWFIQTLDPDLEASIKRILGQTNRVAR